MNFTQVKKLISDLQSKSSLSVAETELLKELQLLLKFASMNNFSLSIAGDTCKCCGKKV